MRLWSHSQAFFNWLSTIRDCESTLFQLQEFEGPLQISLPTENLRLPERMRPLGESIIAGCDESGPLTSKMTRSTIMYYVHMFLPLYTFSWQGTPRSGSLPMGGGNDGGVQCSLLCNVPPWAFGLGQGDPGVSARVSNTDTGADTLRVLVWGHGAPTRWGALLERPEGVDNFVATCRNFVF